MSSFKWAIITAFLIFSDQIIIGENSLLSKPGVSGITKIFDDRNSHLDTLGDPHGGLPDDVAALVKYCANFIYSGLFVIVYAATRWPFKMLTKAIAAVGALGFIKTNAMYCANPITMGDFITKSRLVNAHNERISEFKDEWKKRLLHIIENVRQDEKQMYACCAFHDYKRKVIEEVPEAAEFLKGYFRGYFKLCEIIYCQQYQEGSAQCEIDLSVIDREPSRDLARSWFTHCWELFTHFINGGKPLLPVLFTVSSTLLLGRSFVNNAGYD